MSLMLSFEWRKNLKMLEAGKRSRISIRLLKPKTKTYTKSLYMPKLKLKTTLSFQFGVFKFEWAYCYNFCVEFFNFYAWSSVPILFIKNTLFYLYKVYILGYK
jgi:uncharacterized membrane protein